MAWIVDLDKRAEKELAKLDRPDAQRILNFLYKRVAKRADPRSTGKPLQGTQVGELWRYRVGDYRLICEIQNEALVVLVLRVGHRRDVYRQ